MIVAAAAAKMLLVALLIAKVGIYALETSSRAFQCSAQDANYCLNGGRCFLTFTKFESTTRNGGGVQCACARGFAGERCELIIDERRAHDQHECSGGSIVAGCRRGTILVDFALFGSSQAAASFALMCSRFDGHNLSSHMFWLADAI